jgi:opacity protein-like surface antigen
MKKFLLINLALLILGASSVARADSFTLTTTLPEFSGDPYSDPGPFPSYLVGTFPVAAGYGTITISGTFGNSVVPDSAGVDLFVGSPTVGFFLIAQCFEYDPCWSGSTPTPWSGSGSGTFSDDTWSLFASQTSGTAVQLGVTTITEVATTPEPSTFLLLGTGLLTIAGGLRRRWAR